MKFPDKPEDTLSIDTAILFYILISGQYEEILERFISSNSNPIIQKAAKELENMMRSITDEENNQKENANGIKFMPDGSIDPMSVIQLQEDGL
jgi:hypothetical protein